MSSYSTRPSKKAKTEDTSNKITEEDLTKEKDLPLTGFLNIPQAVLVTIASYTGVEDITNVLSTNRELFSRRDYTMSSFLKGMAREDAFRVFGKLVVDGNTNSVRWFRFKDPSD